MKKAVEIDPRNAHLQRDLGNVLIAARKYQEAEGHYNTSIALEPDQADSPYYNKAWNYILWKGDLRRSRAVLEKAPKTIESDWLYFWYRQEMYERDFDATLRRLTSSVESIDNTTPKDLLISLAYRFSGKPGPAHASFDAARIWLEKELKQRPDDPGLHSALGLAYAGLGRKEEAIREGKRALELLPRRIVARDETTLSLAQIYVLVGEDGSAINEIETVLTMPTVWLSAPTLKLDPIWDPLRSHPRFLKLPEKYKQAGH